MDPANPKPHIRRRLRLHSVGCSHLWHRAFFCSQLADSFQRGSRENRPRNHLCSACSAVRRRFGKANSPPWKGGVAAPLRKCREASLAGADGVVGSSHRLSEVERTTPSAPAKERDHLLDGASTPPLPRRGVRLFHRLFHPLCPADDLWVMIRSGVGAGKRNPQSEISITHVLSSLSGRPGRGGSRR